MQETQVQSLGQEDNLEKLLEKSHGQKSLAGYNPWDRKELEMTW